MKYKNFDIQTTPARKVCWASGVLELGEPEVIAAKDESPGEGEFVSPMLHCFEGTMLLNWSYARDGATDCHYPTEPNGRFSTDGGRTWHKQTHLMPLGDKYLTAPGEVTCYWSAFEIPGRPGEYRIPTQRSHDGGLSFHDCGYTEAAYPGTRGIDLYDEDFVARYGANWRSRAVLHSPPAHLLPHCAAASLRRFANRGGLRPEITGPDGVLYSFVYGRYLEPSGPVEDWDRDFYEKLDWDRCSVLVQRSEDRGRTWTFTGVLNQRDVRDPDTGGPLADGLCEPSAVLFEDGEMVCIMRTGSFRRLFIARSFDTGRTWSTPEPLPMMGVNPVLHKTDGGILVLATGRPDCTVYLSADRGRTWPCGETLFEVGYLGPGYPAYQPLEREDVYGGSHCNVKMEKLDNQTFYYVHDAGRYDPSAPHPWLQKYGHAVIIGRKLRIL